MAKPTGFPRELLTKSKSERREYFRRFTARHPHLDEAYGELTCAITESEPGSIILALGPAGVGKTTLLLRVVKFLVEEVMAELEEDRGRIPVALVEAVSPDSGNFSWLDYYDRFLKALDEPLIGNKIGREEQQASGQQKRLSSREKAARVLRQAVEAALRHRRVFAALVDEAQHFATISSGRKLLDQLNSIKSLSNMTRTTHVLAGTYELQAFRNLSGQLSRRSVDVHFRRYHADISAERQAFVNVLYTFQEHLPLHETPDLVSDWDYYYERTIGCVGILKDWLSRALTLAINEEKKGLTRKIIEQRALSVSQCRTLLAEAVEGEMGLRDDKDAKTSLRLELGLNSEGDPPPRPPEGAPPVVAPPPQQKRRVGTRKPVRDSVRGDASCPPSS